MTFDECLVVVRRHQSKVAAVSVSVTSAALTHCKVQMSSIEGSFKATAGVSEMLPFSTIRRSRPCCTRPTAFLGPKNSSRQSKRRVLIATEVDDVVVFRWRMQALNRYRGSMSCQNRWEDQLCRTVSPADVVRLTSRTMSAVLSWRHDLRLPDGRSRKELRKSGRST